MTAFGKCNSAPAISAGSVSNAIVVPLPSGPRSRAVHACCASAGSADAVTTRSDPARSISRQSSSSSGFGSSARWRAIRSSHAPARISSGASSSSRRAMARPRSSAASLASVRAASCSLPSVLRACSSSAAASVSARAAGLSPPPRHARWQPSAARRAPSRCRRVVPRLPRVWSSPWLRQHLPGRIAPRSRHGGNPPCSAPACRENGAAARRGWRS